MTEQIGEEKLTPGTVVLRVLFWGLPSCFVLFWIVSEFRGCSSSPPIRDPDPVLVEGKKKLRDSLLRADRALHELERALEAADSARDTLASPIDRRDFAQAHSDLSYSLKNADDARKNISTELERARSELNTHFP